MIKLSFKKVLLILLFLIPFNCLANSATSMIAMDLKTGRIVYQKNINKTMLIASTTKIMTAIVAIENGSLDKKITVGDEILKAYGSSIYLEKGEVLSLRDLLYGLLLRSGNDAALVIQKNVSKDFISLMNKYAQDLNMKNTKFVNPHGLEENDTTYNVSTALDMALLTKYAMQNSEFRKIFSTKNYTVKTNYKTHSWKNKNKLLFNYEYTTGGKTGFTKKARRTLVTTASKNNMSFVIVTLNDPNDFSDHRNLYDDLFNSYEAIKVLDKNDFKIKKESKYKDKILYIKNDLYIPVLDNEKKNMRIDYKLIDDKNIKSGSIVGYANIVINDKVIYKEPIYIKSKNENKSFFEKIIGWFKKW